MNYSTRSRFFSKKENFDLEEIIDELKKDKETEKDVVNAAVNRFLNAKTWGLFDKQGTPLRDLALGGQATVLDVSCYAAMSGGWDIKSLVIGLVAKKLFIQRMAARKNEEYIGESIRVSA